MLKTSLCDLFHIDYPIILAPMGSATSAEFAAAASVLRSIRTPFMSEWQGKREQARSERQRLRKEMSAATSAGRRHEVMLTAGQGAGGIKDVLPVGRIMRRMIAEAEQALAAHSQEC